MCNTFVIQFMSVIKLRWLQLPTSEVEYSSFSDAPCLQYHVMLGLVFLTGAGLDVDEYVRRSYKFAHADALEVGPVACLPEPPEPRDPGIRKKNRQLLTLGLMGCLGVLRRLHRGPTFLIPDHLHLDWPGALCWC